jgi:hypothetical protein
MPGDPITGVVTDEQDAQYKKDLRGAGQDCRSKVDYLRDWFHKLQSLTGLTMIGKRRLAEVGSSSSARL